MLTIGRIHGPVLQEEEEEEEALAVQLRPALCECAAHVVAGRFDDANRCFARVVGLASVADGPLQRLAVVMADGLVRRLTAGINRALIDPSSYFDQRSIRAARCNLFELVPFLKVAYVTINRAILDGMEHEKYVHVIDLSGPAAHPWQWLKLMRSLHGRPEGAPHLRITLVHDDGTFLANMEALLRKKADAQGMAFSFHGFLGRLETLDFSNLHDALGIRSGYARAFSCALQMHRLLPVSDTVSNTGTVQLQQVANMAQVQQLAASPTTPLSPFAQTPPSPQRIIPRLLTSFLPAVRALSPKIVAVMEQDAGHNGLDFMARFEEALHYYAALFDALDEAGAAYQMPEERRQVEQVLLGEEIKDMLMREGAERHERHERLHQWAVRMENAGFGGVQLSYIAKMEADEVLRECRLRGYENREQGGCLLLCRSGRSLYFVSAWRPWPSQGSASASSAGTGSRSTPSPPGDRRRASSAHLAAVLSVRCHESGKVDPLSVTSIFRAEIDQKRSSKFDGQDSVLCASFRHIPTGNMLFDSV
ncbi:scarecrow-like protein 3 [Phragmites australis]|uniref:scarecrow-like protein 3 n=1 Tax=Phragmites australis TaxID=29695 RepID=UPI002D78B1A0|nr:scarecrow-like protein 3 [Phragmites australis]